MGIVGVKSTAGREVKFIDPSKTTKSESTWLGYTLCDWYVYYAARINLLTHTLYIYKYAAPCNIIISYTLQ